MATIVTDCPHCGARQAAFEIPFSKQHYRLRSTHVVIGICPSCGNGIVANVHDGGSGYEPYKQPGDLRSSDRFTVTELHPHRPKTNAPGNIPDAVEQSFIEGVDSLNDGRYTAAVAMFRRALELGLKQHTPEIDAWKLEKRIDKLAAAHRITPDMQQWAHKIRLEGNEAVHELDAPTKGQATDLQLFTEMLLLYLYTLPAKVQRQLQTDDANQ